MAEKWVISKHLMVCHTPFHFPSTDKDISIYLIKKLIPKNVVIYLCCTTIHCSAISNTELRTVLKSQTGFLLNV